MQKRLMSFRIRSIVWCLSFAHEHNPRWLVISGLCKIKVRVLDQQNACILGLKLVGLAVCSFYQYLYV